MSTTTNHSVSNKGSAIETSSGTLHVQPYHPSKGSNKLLAKLTFVPRRSQLESSGEDQFRGFYSLFWISIALLMIRTYVASFDETGYPLSLSFAALFSKDALTLALSDAVLVSSTAIVVPFVQLMVKGYFSYGITGMAIQQIYQLVMLVVAVKWTFDRQWEWVQSGFFTLHCIVMIMKMHSYAVVNGGFADLYQQKLRKEATLRSLVETLPGGWAQAQTNAAEARVQERAKTNNNPPLGTATPPRTNNSSGVPTPQGTPRPIVNGIDIGTEMLNTPTQLPAGLRQRALPSIVVDASSPQSTVVPVREGTPASFSTNQPSGPQEKSYFPSSNSNGFPPKTVENDENSPPERHPLLRHPDERIRELAEAIRDLDDEMTSPGDGQKRVHFPENVTLLNFMDYQLIPTLVYELEYPRTDKIRLSYVFEKTVAFLGTFTLLYTITEHYIIPLTPQPGQPFFRSLIDLALPFMLSYLLLFYIIFECICNGFAELSRFADRQFYEDWWNSTSWDEFSRKWNKPVHSFLLRHVYASSITYHKFSKPSAALLTFFLSAVLHELVMAIVTKKLRLYLFAMQMAQLPLIYLGRLPVIRRNKVLGNVVFWIGLLTGFPLLCVAYCAY